MTEREYEHLLDIVQTAVNVDRREAPVAARPDIPRAANDNHAEWPLAPFPKGWHASP